LGNTITREQEKKDATVHLKRKGERSTLGEQESRRRKEEEFYGAEALRFEKKKRFQRLKSSREKKART